VRGSLAAGLVARLTTRAQPDHDSVLALNQFGHDLEVEVFGGARGLGEDGQAVSLLQSLPHHLEPNPPWKRRRPRFSKPKIRPGAQINAPLPYEKTYCTFKEMTVSGGSVSGAPVWRTS